MENEVVKYIKEARQHGLSDLEIKQNLLNVGWEADAVEDSFAYVKASENKPLANRDEDIKTHASQTPDQYYKRTLGDTGGVAHGINSVKPAQLPHEEPQMAAKPASVQTNLPQHALNISKKQSIFKNPKFWTSIILLAMIGVGGYAYYTYAYNSPEKIWNKFVKSEKSSIFESNFTYAYADKGKISSDNKDLASLKGIKLSFAGDSYVNSTDPNNTQSSSKFQYSFSSGNTSISTGAEYILLNKNFYLNVGDNPFLSKILDSVSKGKKYDWIKIDLGAIQDEMAKSNKDGLDKFNEIFNPSFKQELANIWENATLVKIDKYLGREKVGDVNTLHFKNSLDKQALKDAIRQYADKIINALNEKETNPENKLKDEDRNALYSAINSLIDKTNISEFETWIGIKDFKLYKVHLVTSAPSVASIANLASTEYSDMANLPTQNSDTKKISDIRQLSAALESYHKDKGGYPEANNGVPTDISPFYVAVVPVAPSATGNCTDFYNTYWYTPKGEKKTVNGKTLYSSFEYTFCIGTDQGMYKAGIGKLTPSGIEIPITCPGTPEQCSKPSQNQDKTRDEKINEFISKIDFAGEIRIDMVYSNYGKAKQLEAPKEYFDVVNELKNTQSQSNFKKSLTGNIR